MKLILTLVGLVLICIYKILGLTTGGEYFVYTNLVRPIHSLFANFCDKFDFSVAEVLIGLLAILLIIRVIWTVVYIIKKKELCKPIISLVLVFVMTISLIYGGFCILWGVYYSASNVEDICGIHSDGVKHEDLIKVDKLFLEIANEYSTKVTRDSSGCTVYDIQYIFDEAETLYDQGIKIYPGLDAVAHKPKGVHFSEVMSYMDFTGFFFPFTAEANINTHSPDCMIPSTVAHEMAHQRGIAAEDEANFIAIFACMESGKPEYVYSAAIMGLIYLQNALYKSGDKDAWQEIRDSYADGVINDITQNSRYWDKYRESTVQKAANNTYDAFLKSYDQDMGIETYGACVDLLVEYYH